MKAPKEGHLVEIAGREGSRVLAMRRRDLNSLAIIVTFRDGVAYESEEEWGISHFLEHLHLLGTPEYPSLTAISRELECQGGQISAFSTRDSTNYWVKIPSWGGEPAFRVLSSVLSNSNFDSPSIESERTIIFKEMDRERSNFRLYNSLNLESALLSFPIGRYPLGSRDSVNSFSSDFLRRYAAEVYGRRNCSIAVCGAFEEKALKACIERFYHSLPEGRERHLSPPGKSDGYGTGEILEMEYPTLSMVNMVLGWVIDEDMKEQWLPLSLLNTLLGVGFSCLLYQVLREQHHLTYLVSTQLTAYSAGSGGTFRITLDIEPARAGEALVLIGEVIAGIGEGRITERDLSRSRAQLWGNLVLRMDDPMEQARFLSRRILQNSGPLSLAGMKEEIFGVSGRDLALLAGRYFMEEKMKISVAGSRDALASARASLLQ
jgi:predicted Zn-dependent peptidase